MKENNMKALEKLFNQILPPSFWEDLTQKYANDKKVVGLIKQCNDPSGAMMVKVQLDDLQKALESFGKSLVASLSGEQQERMEQARIDLHAKQIEALTKMLGERMRKQLTQYFAMNVESKTPENIPVVTTASANGLLREHKVILCYFSASWCGPCKQLGPVISKLVDGYKGKAFIGKVDIDAQRELAIQYGIKGVPTMIFFKDGAEQQRMVGFQDAKVISNMLDALLE
ncbi:MAG: thioredoxin family protein [Cytophagales bacterium]